MVLVILKKKCAIHSYLNKKIIAYKQLSLEIMSTLGDSTSLTFSVSIVVVCPICKEADCETVNVTVWMSM